MFRTPEGYKLIAHGSAMGSKYNRPANAQFRRRPRAAGLTGTKPKIVDAARGRPRNCADRNNRRGQKAVPTPWENVSYPGGVQAYSPWQRHGIGVRSSRKGAISTAPPRCGVDGDEAENRRRGGGTPEKLRGQERGLLSEERTTSNATQPEGAILSGARSGGIRFLAPKTFRPPPERASKIARTGTSAAVPRRSAVG